MTRDTFKAKGSAAGTDALVARLRMHARDCVSAADMDTDTVLSAAQIDDMADALNEAAEALAAPAESREEQSSPAGAVAWLGVNPRTGEPEISTHKPVSSVMRDFNMRPLVYADTAPPAASVDVEGLRKIANRVDALMTPWGDGDERENKAKIVADLLALIDSAGGAKGGVDVACTDMGNYTDYAFPQPAEGDGAVVSNADVLRAVDVYDNAMGEGWQLPSGKGMRAVLEDFAATSRPAATAARVRSGE